MRRFAVIVLLATSAGCFNPSKPTCSFVCADTDPKCPDDYSCGADNYCHLKNSTAPCGFSDAAAPLSDMSAGDMVSSDQSVALDAAEDGSGG